MFSSSGNPLFNCSDNKLLKFNNSLFNTKLSCASCAFSVCSNKELYNAPSILIYSNSVNSRTLSGISDGNANGLIFMSRFSPITKLPFFSLSITSPNLIWLGSVLAKCIFNC